MNIPKREICARCGDRFCCRGLCREMNDLLVSEKKKKARKRK